MGNRPPTTVTESRPAPQDSAGPGVLYIVATPIGNLEDITLRALRILREVDAILAEDTRVTRKLLSHYDIHTPLTSYHAHSPPANEQAFVVRLERGESLALVSDAGTPCISDPGHGLVSAAAEAGIPVVPIPGCSAHAAALCVSGIATGRFAFDRFPPRGRSDRRAFFEALKHEQRAVVLYEAPHRLVSTLRELLRSLGDRKVVVGRELTKAFEEIYRGTTTEALERFAGTAPRGEFTIVIHPPDTPPIIKPAVGDVADAIVHALASGMSRSDAVRHVTATLGISRREAYRVMLEHQEPR